MPRKQIKCGLMLAVAAMALAGCDKADGNATGAVSGKTFTEVLTVPKGYHEVGGSGRVYTTDDLLFSKVHAQVMLTKFSGRNASTFSLSESDTGYAMTVRRMKPE